MTETLTVRFCEHQRYDITLDEERVLLMAITPTGTFSADVPADPKRLRSSRKAFEDYVFQSMALHHAPHEVHLG